MSDHDAKSDAKSDATKHDDGPGNFVWELVQKDLSEGKNAGRVMTRFPPEPNGYLHIGHAKSICTNFGIANRVPGGKCNLRFDDTNPETEEVEYVESIKADVRWLGFDWENRLYFASDYFDKLYEFAQDLVKRGDAYVDSRTEDQIKATRGDFYHPGEEGPYRARSIDENLDLFTRMKAGEFPDGAHVLRAKGDMAGPDVKMRDPLMYRIRHAKHHRTGDKWCIYPLYDWAHGQSDYIEGITHSVCTLEFVNHRPLYNFYLDKIGAPKDARPQQIEFAKLNLTYTMFSKRRLKELVMGKHVNGWDDPRMPTLAGARRRGVTPEALRAFCDRVGVSTKDTVVDIALFDHALREDLNARSPRVMGVLRPLKITIENFPANLTNDTIEFTAPYDPEKPEGPSRTIPLTREVFIEREDFAEIPPKKWFRLAPGQEVRLRHACIIKCQRVIKDDGGQVTELVCTWDPDSHGGAPKDGRKIKGTLHWVSAKHGARVEVRLYDRLFTVENPMAEEDWIKLINPKSLEILHDSIVEPSVKTAKPGERFQFERVGYFCVDTESRENKLIFNRTITLKDGFTPSASQGAAPNAGTP